MPTESNDARTNPTVQTSGIDPKNEQTKTPTAAPSPDASSRTTAENKLRAALLAHPLSTAEDLTAIAGIGRSTASKILTQWMKNNTVTRTSGQVDGARRGADRWSFIDPDLAPAAAPAPAGTSPQPDTAIAEAEDAPADAATTDPDDPTAERERTEEELAVQSATTHTDEHNSVDETRTAISTEQEPPQPGGTLAPDPEGDTEPTPPQDGTVTEPIDSLGVIELGNGIMVVYPVATFSTPTSCAEGSPCGMVDLLRLLAAVTTKAKPVRKSPQRPTTPRDPGMNQSGTPRLAKGALRGMVEDFLTERPGEEFSPNEVAIALGRSTGAVSNALDQMENDGVVTMTNEKPRRYTFADSE